MADTDSLNARDGSSRRSLTAAVNGEQCAGALTLCTPVQVGPYAVGPTEVMIAAGEVPRLPDTR